MRKFTFLASLIFTTIFLQAQNYLIDFTSQSSTVDSVKVENLTQGTNLTLDGTDTLHLKVGVGIDSYSEKNSTIQVYPNPMYETSNIEFYSAESGKVDILIFDITGKDIAKQNIQIHQGLNKFEISGIKSGIYAVNLIMADMKYSVKLISISNTSGLPSIKYQSVVCQAANFKTTLTGSKGLIQMGYNDGENLLFTAYLNNATSLKTLIPTSSQTLDFVFTTTGCPAYFTDSRDGHLYQALQLGNQCWMTTNLAYLPAVSPADSGSFSSPYYYVFGYNGSSVIAAKATTNWQTFGVLYNWPASMNGANSSSSNPSGVQGVCPSGWHLPSDDEWKELEMHLGMSQTSADSTGFRGSNEGSQMAGDITLWNPGGLSSDSAFGTSGFACIPGGYRHWGGTFHNIGSYGNWWSCTESASTYAWSRNLNSGNSKVFRIGNYDVDYGQSIRCIKD